VPFGPAVALFLLISAVAHFYLATIGYDRYVANLKKGMNPVRFYEYALSSSLMIVLIGMLIGLWDLGAIILLFTLNATMNLFGIMMEYHNQHTKRTDWTSFIYGCIAGFVPWVVVTLYFVGAVNSGDANPPAFVYTIVPTLFVFFNIFAINMVLQYKKVGRLCVCRSLFPPYLGRWAFKGNARLHHFSCSQRAIIQQIQAACTSSQS
jgi:hypothetical protein